jgi:hypothetical protein
LQPFPHARPDCPRTVGVGPQLDEGLNCGRRPAQAESAFSTEVLFVLSVLRVVLLEGDPLGRVTPWAFRQFRYAVKAEPEKPAPALEPKPSWGRRLAHVANACRNADEPKPQPVGKLPLGRLAEPPKCRPCARRQAAKA